MKKKPEKQKDMEVLRAELAKAQNVFLTGYEKLTVQQDFELRKTVRGAGASYKVIKNNIAEKASAIPISSLVGVMNGSLKISRMRRSTVSST